MILASNPLDLDEYRALVRLDDPFEPRRPAPEAKAARAAMADKLLAHLRSERNGVDANIIPPSYDEKRRLLRALLTVRGPDPLPAWFHERIDQLLQHETQKHKVTDAAGLPRVAQLWPRSPYPAAAHCALWQGDITSLKVDAIVNAANAQMLGCFQPFHACIDNAIHAAAGPRLREDCHAMMQRQGNPEGTGWAKITRGYNLPTKYILHTVGPILGPDKEVQAGQEQQLAACYNSCLDLAHRVLAIRSVAFCCISTGIFGFPQMPAARIALKTVEQWLTAHPGALDLVIFNVFRRDDLEIYAHLLQDDWTRGMCISKRAPGSRQKR